MLIDPRDIDIHLLVFHAIVLVLMLMIPELAEDLKPYWPTYLYAVPAP